MSGNSLEMQALVVGREGAGLTPPITETIVGGEMLAIRGGNGSGKSTLLKTVAGLLRPMSGNVIHRGTTSGPILYLGHKLGLVRELSVYDNVALWGRLHCAPELISAALHYFDLDDIADAPLSTLSAGWQQRVALTRLITIPSALWLLDEPTANLDAEGVALLHALLQSRMEQGGVILLATHHEMQGNKVKTLNINAIN